VGDELVDEVLLLETGGATRGERGVSFPELGVGVGELSDD